MRNQHTADVQDALTPQPLYGQVRQALVDRIRSGEWMIGDSLPNETFLAQRFGVSVGTVRKAIEGLENNGLVKRIQGRGTYVAGVGSHVLREKFFRIRDSSGDFPNNKYDLLDVRRVSTAAVENFDHKLWPSDELIAVTQRIVFDRVAVGVEKSFLNPMPLPNFQKQLTFGQDLYGILADYGFIVTRAEDTLSFVLADSEVGECLDLDPGTQVMRITRKAYGLDRGLLEYRSSHYRLDRVSYRADLD